MPPGYLLDEHLRGLLWQVIQRHNLQSPEPLDVIRVGDPADLPLGSSDAAILLWAEQHARILISRDERTLATHLANHLQSGHHSPGIFLVRRRCALSQVVAFLVEAAYRSSASSWQDRIEYIP